MSAPAGAGSTSDIHGMGVGMFVADLPDDMTWFSCMTDAARRRIARKDWKSCSTDADGLRAVEAALGPPDAYRTRIAGHPVRLELFLDRHGYVAKITIETEAGARAPARAEAYLLGLQARHHYGDDHWTCTASAPAPDEEPAGPTYIKEHCSKRFEDRDIVMERRLLRRRSAPGQFVNMTRIVIVWIGEST